MLTLISIVRRKKTSSVQNNLNTQVKKHTQNTHFVSSLSSDGPVPMPNVPNQIINRMQVSQGTSPVPSPQITSGKHICFLNSKQKFLCNQSCVMYFLIHSVNPFSAMPNVPMSQAPMAARAASPINHQQINMNQVPTVSLHFLFLIPSSIS